MVVLAIGGLLARPAGAQEPPLSPDMTEEPPLEGRELRVALAYSGPRGTVFFSDGHFVDAPTFDAGIEAEYLLVPGRIFHWGVGLRYSAGFGSLQYVNGPTETEHLVFVPLLVGWSARVSAAGDELGLILGLGPALGAFSLGAGPDGHVWTKGLGAEIGVTFIHPVSGDLALTAGVSARLIALSAISGGTYYNLGFHGEIPFHLGVRFRL